MLSTDVLAMQSENCGIRAGSQGQ